MQTQHLSGFLAWLGGLHVLLATKTSRLFHGLNESKSTVKLISNKKLILRLFEKLMKIKQITVSQN